MPAKMSLYMLIRGTSTLLSDMDTLPTLQLDSLIFLGCQGLQCGIVPAVAA